ncbi:type IV pilin N-terminal domain-containing protein [Salinirubellus sp. GCM10025818]|uniref:type IV pilin N-terminal domain-containing protein n=1 Tax=Salinirubellus TaxID=2162630 RepID=UPI0030CDC488
MVGNRERRALTPVVGGVLIVAIAVILATIVATLGLGFTSYLGDPAAVAGIGQSVEVTIGADETSHTLQLVHHSGQTIPVESLTVVVSGGESTTRTAVPATGALADGAWSAGEPVTLPLKTSTVCAGDPDSVEITLVQQTNAERTHQISSQTVPVQPGQFVISEGSVEPTVDYSADVELLGTAFTYGAGGPDIPIEMEVTVGDETNQPWPGNVNDGGNPRTTNYADREAGESIVVTAEAQPHEGYSGHEVDSVADEGTFVHVLRDGSDAPDVEGFADQDDAEAFVAEYVDDGAIELDDNQAIYLFELSHSTENSGADFQDAVVLVSLETNTETVTVGQNDEGEDVILCPTEA